jgi:cell division protein FtsB
VIQHHVETKENEVAKLTLELAVLSKENTELKARLRDIADKRNH